VNNANLISKFIFSRLVMPTAAVLCRSSGSGHFVRPVVWAICLLQGIADLASAGTPLVSGVDRACGAGGRPLFFSALNVKYATSGMHSRSWCSLGMFVTPIIYPLSLVPQNGVGWWDLNPLAAVVEGFRACCWAHASIGRRCRRIGRNSCSLWQVRSTSVAWKKALLT